MKLIWIEFRQLVIDSKRQHGERMVISHVGFRKILLNIHWWEILNIRIVHYIFVVIPIGETGMQSGLVGNNNGNSYNNSRQSCFGTEQENVILVINAYMFRFFQRCQCNFYRCLWSIPDEFNWVFFQSAFRLHIIPIDRIDLLKIIPIQMKWNKFN